MCNIYIYIYIHIYIHILYIIYIPTIHTHIYIYTYKWATKDCSWSPSRSSCGLAAVGVAEQGTGWVLNRGSRAMKRMEGQKHQCQLSKKRPWWPGPLEVSKCDNHFMFLDIFWIKCQFLWVTGFTMVYPHWSDPKVDETRSEAVVPCDATLMTQTAQTPGMLGEEGPRRRYSAVSRWISWGTRKRWVDDDFVLFCPFHIRFFVGRIWDEGFVGVCEGKLQGNCCVSSEIDGLGIRVRAERETQLPTPLLGTGWSRKIIEDERCVVYPLVN